MARIARLILMTVVTIYLSAVGAAGPNLSMIGIAVAAVVVGLPALALVNALDRLEKRVHTARYLIPLIGLSPLLLFASLALFLGVRGFGNAYSGQVMLAGFIWSALWYGTSFFAQNERPATTNPLPKPSWGRGQQGHS